MAERGEIAPEGMGERGEEDGVARVAAQDGVAEAAGNMEAGFAGHPGQLSLTPFPTPFYFYMAICCQFLDEIYED